MELEAERDVAKLLGLAVRCARGGNFVSAGLYLGLCHRSIPLTRGGCKAGPLHYACVEAIYEVQRYELVERAPCH